jgi:hypothetical protein
VKPFNSRWLSYFLALACICAALVMLRSGGNREGQFWQKYQQVQPGMAKEQVEAILGPPDDEDKLGGGTCGRLWCTWREGDQKIVVELSWDFCPGAVWETRKKDFYPKTAWEKVEDGAADIRRRARELP